MTALDDFRTAKDAFYQTSADSPLLPEQKKAFSGLNYYSEEPALAFEVTPDLFDEPEMMDMQTSTGDAARYLRWARLSFSTAGAPMQLTVFRDPGTESYFLPFQDSGRGNETYGAGRYVDVEPLDDGGCVWTSTTPTTRTALTTTAGHALCPRPKTGSTSPFGRAKNSSTRKTELRFQRRTHPPTHAVSYL